MTRSAGIHGISFSMYKIKKAKLQPLVDAVAVDKLPTWKEGFDVKSWKNYAGQGEEERPLES
jgi:hypothetical protein